MRVPRVQQGSATELPYPDNFFDAVLTDPPYYDNVPYADLSDFFFVWLKRTVGDLHPELFATPLAPKSQEMVADASKAGGMEEARRRFEEMLTQAFREIHRVLKPDGIAVIVFAHKTTAAWETVLQALLDAGLYMTASWPIHTEMQARLRAQESAALASSIYMVCRKRTTEEIGDYTRVRREIEARVRERLAQFWEEGIRGADFFMSAIGPAVEVFGRYARVEKLSGEEVTVAELLEYVRKVVAEFALERILRGAELSGVDPLTRFYLLWRWTYNHARVPFDEARKLAAGAGIELTAHWGPGGWWPKTANTSASAPPWSGPRIPASPPGRSSRPWWTPCIGRQPSGWRTAARSSGSISPPPMGRTRSSGRWSRRPARCCRKGIRSARSSRACSPAAAITAAVPPSCRCGGSETTRRRRRPWPRAGSPVSIRRVVSWTRTSPLRR
jgi:SAM-dependent methyltransferase